MENLFLDTLGKLDPISILLVLLIVYREGWYWPGQIKKREDEIERSHAAHETTRVALLQESRNGSETLVLVRDQLKSQEAHRTALESLMRLIADELPVQRRRS